MNECTKEQQHFSNQNDIEEKPIHLSNSVYKNDCNNKKINNSIDQLAIWRLEKCNPDNQFNIFETNFNDLQENVTSEEKNTNIEQCICINAWNQLKQVFELPDEELKTIRQLKNTIPDDTFYTMPIDLGNDDCGDNLEDFLLDGEYIFKEDDDDLNITDIKKEANTYVPEKQLVIDETKDATSNEVIINNDHIQNKENINTNTKANYMIDTNKNKNISFNSESTDKKTKSVNKKQNVKNVFKDTLRPVKCCGVKFKVIKKEEKENNMKYVYTYGEHYRGGINCGHKDCVDCWIPIPRNKGWITDSFLQKVSIFMCIYLIQYNVTSYF